MREVEIKIFDVDKKALIKKLSQLKAKKEYAGLFKVAYFDFKDKRIQKADEVLRLRQSEDKKAELVYKHNRRNIKGMKVCEELKATCDNLQNMENIFYKLGFQKNLYYEKKRTTYKLAFSFQLSAFRSQAPRIKDKIKTYNSVVIEFDEYPNGFSYIEIEADTVKQVSKAIALLGLEHNEKSNETVDEVFDRKFGKGSLNKQMFNH